MILNPILLTFISLKTEKNYILGRSKFYSKILLYNISAFSSMEFVVLMTDLYHQFLSYFAMITLCISIFVSFFIFLFLKKNKDSCCWMAFLMNANFTLVIFINLKDLTLQREEEYLLDIFLLTCSFSNFQSIFLTNPKWFLSFFAALINVLSYLFAIPFHRFRMSVMIYSLNALFLIFNLYDAEKGRRLLFFQDLIMSKIKPHGSQCINFKIKRIKHKKSMENYEVCTIGKFARKNYGLTDLDHITKFFELLEIEDDITYKELIKVTIPYLFRKFAVPFNYPIFSDLWNFTNLLLGLQLIHKIDIPISILINCHILSDIKKKYLIKFTFYTFNNDSFVYIIIHDHLLEEKVQELEELDKLKDCVMANVSHDLRNPLNAILFYVNEAKRENLKKENLIEYMNFAEIQGVLLMSLINDILDYALIQNERLRIHCEEFDLRQLIKEVLILFNHTAAEKNVALITNFENQEDMILTDPIRLKQILINFISNSLKFTIRGEIKLTIKFDKTFFFFEIKDTGVGISQENMEKLFEPFTTYEAEGLNKKGIGLGLMISKKIVNVLGPNDNLKIESELGTGTVINFRIYKDFTSKNLEINETNKIKPIISNILTKKVIKSNTRNIFLGQNELNQLLVEEKKSNLQIILRNRKKINILIADDTLMNIVIIKSYISKLEMQNFIKLDEASNGKEALLKFKEKNSPNMDPYEIILLDCEMPIMNGFEISKEIKYLIRNENFVKCNIIAFTGYDDIIISNSGQFDGILKKPVSLEKFADFFLDGVWDKFNN